jgi:hypothetical protein
MTAQSVLKPAGGQVVGDTPPGQPALVTTA